VPFRSTCADLCRLLSTDSPLGYGPSVLRSIAKAQGQTIEACASVDDVAAHLGLVRDSAYRWGRPAHRIWRLWEFKLSEVDAWVRSGGAEVSRTTRRAR
jgi:hypothetical protein